MINKFYNILEKILIILLVSLLSLMILLIFSQVFFRYILNNPLSWAEELSRHMMIWSVFIGAAIAYRNNSHMGIDLIYGVLPKEIGKFLMSFTHFGILLFSLFLLFKGYEISEKTMGQLSSALRIKMGYIYIAIPIGFAMIAMFSVEHIINLWAEKINCQKKQTKVSNL